MGFGQVDGGRAPVRVALFALLAYASSLSLGCSGSAVTGSFPPSDTEDALDVDTTAPDTSVADGDTAGDTAADAQDASDTAPDGGDTVVGPTPDWAVVSLGDVGAVRDVFAVSASEAYAVGGPRVLRYNGSGWATWGEPGAAALHGVWAGDGVVMVVGEGGLVATRAVGADHWDLGESGVTVTLRGIYGRGAGDVWVFGDDATVLHWDGAAWTREFTLPGIALYSAWIAPDTTGHEGVYAVGSGGLVVQYQAGAWRTVQIAAGTAELHDIFGVDGTLFAVGTGATITVKTPVENWRGQTSNDPRDRDLYAIVGRSATDVVAFGEAGAVIRFNGNKWNTEQPTGPQWASADLISAAWVDDGGADRYLAVAATGGGLALDSGKWVDMATRPERGVRDFAGSAERLWAVGKGGLVLERSEQGWSSVAVATVADLNAVDVAADGTVWAVGTGGAIVRIAPDGSVTFPASGLPIELHGVAVASDRVWICGNGGTLLSAALDGSDVTLELPGTSASLRAVTVGGDGAVWIVGGVGTLLRLTAGDAVPTVVSSGVGATLNDAVATADGVLVAGDNGVIIEATAAGAVLRHEDPGLFLYGIAASGSAQFAVGWNGSILRRSGDEFAPEVSGVNGVLQAAWTDATEAIAGGREGILLERVEAP
ncbi:MAG: hypothetical protein CVU56_05340 [Deltaproteobacteria bacterium HGW-Deltaproteobacteria-14]|jgi:hypothetical protein|nr:MAG: hypothetical protein CVU56_05340 [Deltaproteobacteria bacterium HGW-Deltaproteobacteria-14]